MRKINLSEKQFNIGLLLLFMVFALYCALKATKGLIIPVEQDDYRDMAIAENMLHGNYTHDPSYLNELLWYNPFLPAFNAILSRITGLPLNIIVTHAGKFFNLLIPFSIYYMGVKLFDRKTALAIAAASIFFVCGNDYGEHTSGYTYIWVALCFSQVLFYVAIVFANKILQEKKYIRYLLLGAFTGLLFLCHSATSFIFCIVLVCCFVHAFIKKEISFKELILNGLLFSAGLIVTGYPLLNNIFLHYHYTIKNVDPTQWVYFLFEPEQVSLFLKETINIYFVIAVIGLIALTRNKIINKITKRLILYWFWGSTIIFLYVYFIVILRTKYNINLPGFVPSSDVFFCVKSAEAVLFGVGFYEIVSWLFTKFGASWKTVISAPFYSLLILLVLLRVPSYAHRKEYVLLRSQTVARQEGFKQLMGVYSWLKTNTDINDVVLSKMDFANFPVMASGRKMVAAYVYYSSPYVSYLDRKKDADTMLSGLQTNANIQALLTSYKVKYLLLPISDVKQYQYAAGYFPAVAYSDSIFVVRKRQ